MTSILQLISFCVSFIYGIIFYFITLLNFKLISDLKLFWQHIITMIYVFDMIIIYIIIFFHLNKGYFHIYFIAMVIIGYLIGFIINKKLISKLNVNNIFKRCKTKWVMLVSNWNRMILWLKVRKKLVKKKKNVFF